MVLEAPYITRRLLGSDGFRSYRGGSNSVKIHRCRTTASSVRATCACTLTLASRKNDEIGVWLAAVTLIASKNTVEAVSLRQ